MLVSNIAENVSDIADDVVAALKVDYVEFDNETRLKRIQRVATQGGTEIALRLPNDFREIADGDVLFRDDANLVLAKILPTDVLVIRPRTIYEMGVVAHSLGNRHMQAQFFDKDSEFAGEVMVVRYDHTTEHFLNHVEVPYERGDYVMPHAFRHAEHTH